jgi:hypothetical protein
MRPATEAADEVERLRGMTIFAHACTNSVTCGPDMIVDVARNRLGDLQLS